MAVSSSVRQPESQLRKLPGSRNHGRKLYTTALILTFLLCISYLRGDLSDDPHRFSPSSSSPQSLVTRADHDAPNLQCRLVKKAIDQCSFVKDNCPDEEAGLVSYLQFFYCAPPATKPLVIILIVLWACLLFTSIGIAASDFLCINLSTIASILRMSESLTGVTFLAFGNGSPDVFSTFAAMKSNSGSLAVGELMGAAGFITAVVAGSMALVKPFQVARRSFIRDVGFFAVSASFSLVFLADGSLRLWECAAMVAYYFFYVIFVVVWHWHLGRRRRKRLAETAARLHHHIPHHQELDVPEGDEDDEESRPASERASLLRSQSGGSLSTLQPPDTPAWKVEVLDDDDEVRDRYLATLRSQMRVTRPTRGERRNTITPIRPSLIGALEFRSVMSSLEKKGTNIPLGFRRYSDDAGTPISPIPISAPPTGDHAHAVSQDYRDTARSLGTSSRNRAVSANDAAGLRIDTTFLSDHQSEHAVSTEGSLTPTPDRSSRPSGGILRMLNEPSVERSPSPKLVISPSGHRKGPDTGASATEALKSPNLLAPPPTTFHRPDYAEDHRGDSLSPALSPRSTPTLQVPVLRTPHPDHSRSLLQAEDFPPYVDSPMVATPTHSRPPSIHLPAPSMSPESTHNLPLLPDDEEEGMRTFSWWPYHYLVAPQIILQTLFPTLYDWRQRSITDKVLGLITAVPLFLLKITLPVVEPREEDEEPEVLIMSPGGGYRSRSQSRLALAPDTPAIAPRQQANDASAHQNGSRVSSAEVDFAKQLAEQRSEASEGKEWNRWLLFVQVFTAPFFVVSTVWVNLEDDATVRLYIRMVLGALVVSLVMMLGLLATTTPRQEPNYRPLFCFLGFLVAIAWISTIANEVVGVLKAFGVITGMSDAILGLTIFAMGNSVGDWVADVTVARLGYPVMALSACFGGPMLNILLGIGLGGMYMTIHNASHKHAKHPHKPIHYKPYELEVNTTLMISGITLLATLIGLLIVVPLNGWRMDRKIGLGLITVWVITTTVNVIVEIVSKDDVQAVSMGSGLW
ncbi:hypothetical protein B0A52_02806 [Exophiala mesophila]|uniref:Sodium/calcium exchanger membrane region domain-containing protein n=1 Tax=Exophiala mesophila TaxID=212818 RepID=A0A438NDZ9_EXOME|nr:hypothetical protein B0A52_02806 [Exophiala mesophila]